ncbi:MAG: nucleotidyltransferase domain-containing protein [Spirochaetales bacterium]|nr:nucleotidyltransferase domain-containing protein [Spirochaetales bacterium]
MTELRIIKDTLLKKKIKLQEFGISEIGIFGSYIRGEETDNSDVDILIDVVRPSSLDLFDLISLEQELSEELNTPVDLVLKTSLKPIINESILSEVQYL